MYIPESFKHKIEQSFGERGSDWLVRLPHLYDSAVRKWSLTNCTLAPDLFYNLICFGDSPAFGQVVLKLGVLPKEVSPEMMALQRYGGRDSCACHDADLELGALLLERIVPGTDLTGLPTTHQRSAVAAGLMARLPVPLADGHGFPVYGDLLRRAFGRVREEQRAGPEMLSLVEAAEALFREMEGAGRPTVLLHGDLHHKNILQDRRGGWKAIDPKGIAGVAPMESARFIQNELALVDRSEEQGALIQMIDLFSAELGESPRTIAACLFVDKVLSTCWGIEENYEPAELNASLRQCHLFRDLLQGI